MGKETLDRHLLCDQKYEESSGQGESLKLVKSSKLELVGSFKSLSLARYGRGHQGTSWQNYLAWSRGQAQKFAGSNFLILL